MVSLDRGSPETGSLHRLAELRSLAYHQAVALRLHTEPALLACARERVEQWLREGGRSAEYARRWREILERPIVEIVNVMVADTETSQALRQATPFAGVLGARERWELWRRVRDDFGSGS